MVQWPRGTIFKSMARAKPDRAIAAEIGVSNQTVRRARRKTTVTNVTVGDGKRTGRDGKPRHNTKSDEVSPTSAPVPDRIRDLTFNRMAGKTNPKPDAQRAI